MNDSIRLLHGRLIKTRTRMINDYPFFGTMLMKLKLGIAPCGTAFTDAVRIVFDPVFAGGLDDDQLLFVMLHEALHVALGHCFRGRELNHECFNIACDTVVNSIALKTMGLASMRVGGSEVFHLAPDGREGECCSAEEIYHMLEKDRMNQEKNPARLSLAGAGGRGSDPQSEVPKSARVDRHDVWTSIKNKQALADEWDTFTQKNCSLAGTPFAVRKIVALRDYKSGLDWPFLLHDFIQIHFDANDYSFLPPDRRFAHRGMALPSFVQEEEKKWEKLWFVVDTSASIRDTELQTLMMEICAAIEQTGRLSGFLSFFDTEVTEPVPFDNPDALKHITPTGGGGTSFQVIFDKLDAWTELPKAILILTDGIAPFPSEKAARQIPVLWIIIGTEVKPAWGNWIKIPDPPF